MVADLEVLSNVVWTQQVHEDYGGVVPELASRAHTERISQAVIKALSDARLSLNEIDAVAYTVGPGLIGALMVGSAFAKGLSLVTKKPLLEANHLHAHVLAHCLKSNDRQLPEFPFLCLLASGGHTQLVAAHSPLHLEIVGRTVDDAAGEAFDKCAKLLGIPYPGGPALDKLAQLGKPLHPIARPVVEGLDYSFSGIKTSVLYYLRQQSRANHHFITENLPDLCASVQEAIVDTLMDKMHKAMAKTGFSRLAVAGGVAANSLLRKRMAELASQHCQVHIPPFSYCTDNAAMIAAHGHFLWLDGRFGSLNTAPMARIHSL